MKKQSHSLVTILWVVLLAACGGGGGGGGGSTSDLKISEIASCFYTNVTCWFEIYNPTSATINLSSYQIQASSVNVTNGSLETPITTYTLPSFEIAAGGYAIVNCCQFRSTTKESFLH